VESSKQNTKPHWLYRRNTAFAQLLLVGLLVALSSQGSGRGGLVGVYMIGYPVIFLINLILAVVYGVRHNTTLMRFHVLILLVLLLAAVPLFMVILNAVGGMC
jgi:hypothetical protein